MTKDNRTQAELRQYPTGCRGSLADAAWCALLGVHWDINPDEDHEPLQAKDPDYSFGFTKAGKPAEQAERPETRYQQMRQRYSEALKQTQEREEIDTWIRQRKVLWAKKWGQAIAEHLERFIRLQISAGKMKYSSPESLNKTVEAIEKDTEQKIKAEQKTSAKLTAAYDTGKASRTVYQVRDQSGRIIELKVIGRIGHWVKLNTEGQSSWYHEADNTLRPATSREHLELEKQFKAVQKLSRRNTDNNQP